MSNTPKIDELIGEFDTWHTCNLKECEHYRNYVNAKEALYQLILEVIGEDELQHDIHLMDKNTAIFLNNKIAFCNGLRAEQRLNLNNLFGKDK